MRLRLGGDTDSPIDFKVAFLDAGGALIQTMQMQAETVTSATQRAGEIASEIDAADFFITSKPAHPPQRRRIRLLWPIRHVPLFVFLNVHRHR
jgi:hypothetical protein